MEQGNRLDSTPVSARQDANGTTDEPGLDRAVTALLTRPEPVAQATEGDPIFVIIEEGMRLQAEESALLDAGGDKPDDHPSWIPERAAHAAMWKHVDDVLLKTTPATPAGGIALARFALHFRKRQGVTLEDADEGRDVLGLIAAISTGTTDSSGAAQSGAAAPYPDPILPLIEEGRRLLQASDALHARPPAETPDAEADADAERSDALRALWAHCDGSILATVPMTATGCRELARFAEAYAASNDVPISDDPQAIVRLIAASPLLGAASAAPADDAFADPDRIEGFIPYPAYKPAMFLAIELAIPREAKRLLDIAQAEFDRRAPYYADFPTEERAAHLARMRAEYRIDALEALAQDTKTGNIHSVSPLAEREATVWSAVDEFRRHHESMGERFLAADGVRRRQAGEDCSPETLDGLEAAATDAAEEANVAWRKLFTVQPPTVHGVLHVLRCVKEHAESYTGILDEPDVFGAFIGWIEALRFTHLPRPADHDFSRLSISMLEHLANIASREYQALSAVECLPTCHDRGQHEHTPLGEIVEAEGERMAFLRDCAVHEIERRRPTEKHEINLRLEALVRHDLNCNGYIEPELMAEVVQTWGRG